MTEHPTEPERCETCGQPAWGYWGWDGTPLCERHYRQAERRREAVERRELTPDPRTQPWWRI